MARFRSLLTRRGVLSAAAGGAVTMLAPAAGAQQAAQGAPARAAASQVPTRPLQIDARPIASFSRLGGNSSLGRLSFRGGLVLTSPDKDFGGLSGLVVDPDGKGLLAIGDAGNWQSGVLTYEGAAPRGITAARIGPILAMSGRALGRRRDVDAEAVALAEGSLARGTLLVAFERNHRIGRFPVVDRVLQAPTGYLKPPAESKEFSSNKGFEAVTVLAGGPHRGAVVALAERFVDGSGHHSGWIWIGGEPRRFQITDLNEFDLTDCASLADGSLLVLERRFRWTEGVKMQLRLIPAAEIAPGSIAKGTLLLAATMADEIDNMEGLALHRDARGATVLTLVSDDNFNSFLQRTLLLQFTLG